MLKKLPFFLTIFFLYSVFTIHPVFAACTPPTDYSSCPEKNPDINLNVRGYTPITGSNDLNHDYKHEQDPQTPPQLNTLFEHNIDPYISGLYQVKDANTSSGYVSHNTDVPSDFASLVGFEVASGTNVLVPQSGYDIGNGYAVTVLYATNTSLTLKYGSEDDITTGYTLHLDGLSVAPDLLALYNQANQNGRTELPALSASELLGTATGQEIKVAIRDTGSFLDPRWVQDWWHDISKSAEMVARRLKLLKLIKLTAPSCPIDKPNPPTVSTKGQSFVITINSCDPATKQIAAALRTIIVDIADNQVIADEYKTPLSRLTPYNPTLSLQVSQAQKPITSEGNITFEACGKNDPNNPDDDEFYSVENNKITFQMPGWIGQWAAQSQLTARYLVPGGGAGSLIANNIPQEKTIAQNSETSVLGTQTLLAQKGEAGPIPHGCKYYYSNNGSDPTDCSCLATGTCRGEHSGAGCCPPHGFWGVCGWDDCKPQVRCPGQDLQNVCPGFVLGGGPITPPKKQCQETLVKGQNLNPFAIKCINGSCRVVAGSGSEVDDLAKPIYSAVGNLIGYAKKLLCGEKQVIITPDFEFPYLSEIEQYNEKETSSIFKVISPDAQAAFNSSDALQNSTHRTDNNSDHSSDVPILWQKGNKDSWQWVGGALAPYGQ